MSAILGFAAWSPSEASARLIDQVQDVLEENADYLPMTGRQVFYRLVGAHGYGKTEKKYKALLAKIARARRARMIGFEAIRDDGVSERDPGGFSSPEDWLAFFRSFAKNYRRQRQDDQEEFLELWVEAAGMVPQAARVANPYGVPVYSSGGFNSVTMKHAAARRFYDRFKRGRQLTHVLHIGDRDPSGESIFENLAADVPSFCWSLGFESKWTRIAVTEEQVKGFGLEQAPPKPTDSRSAGWVGGTVQVEAMSPAELAGEIEDAISAHMDLGIYEVVLEAEEGERADLLRRLDKLLSTEGG